jgi:hypothetical protein
MVDLHTAKRMQELEDALLLLGREEVEIEAILADLLVESRSAGLSGDYARSDLAWEKYEKLKTAKSALTERIFGVEKVLYRLRREQSNEG